MFAWLITFFKNCASRDGDYHDAGGHFSLNRIMDWQGSSCLCKDWRFSAVQLPSHKIVRRHIYHCRANYGLFLLEAAILNMSNNKCRQVRVDSWTFSSIQLHALICRIVLWWRIRCQCEDHHENQDIEWCFFQKQPHRESSFCIIKLNNGYAIRYGRQSSGSIDCHAKPGFVNFPLDSKRLRERNLQF